ncbi:MAG: hypothetical protein RLZZ299_1626 [Pseudomonadota bacterium]|jgi:hypothetical protein
MGRLFGDDLAVRVRDGRADPRRALLHAQAHVRRAGAWAIGMRGDPTALSALSDALSREWTGNGTLALAVAATRCGADAGPLRAMLRAREAWRVPTPDGWRMPHAVVPLDLVDRFDAAVATDLGAPGGGGSRAEVLARAARGMPGDRDGLVAMARGGARREGHLGLQALGIHGDPRSVAELRTALEALDVDPGRGFAWRRLAAAGLGRIGDARALPWLLDALQAERRDHEGRPGAGLGIQAPVRAEMLLAIGELGDVRAVPALLGALGDATGSATGGLYLPACAGLRALGPAILPALRATIDDPAAPPLRAGHAVGLLHVLGVDIGAWSTDPRGSVRLTVEVARTPDEGGPWAAT